MFTIFIICLLNPMISTKLLLLESEDKGTKKALKMEPGGHYLINQTVFYEFYFYEKQLMAKTTRT